MRCLPLLCCVFFLALPLPAAAGVPQAGELMAFADHLFEQGDYYRAITEYERVLFHHSGHALADRARFQIALAYFKGDKLDQAIKRFRELARDPAGGENSRAALLMLGEAQYRKGDLERAAESYAEFLAAFPGDPRAEGARIKLGLALLRKGEWQQAAEELRQMPEGVPLRQQALELAAAAEGYPGIPRRSPALAGALSTVLPGAGQLYVGRPGDALTSFLLNGVFIWATVEAFQQDHDAAGGILLFFETGWYLGNIYNAVSSAHKYNRRSAGRFLDDQEDRYGVQLSWGGDGTAAALFALRF